MVLAAPQLRDPERLAPDRNGNMARPMSLEIVSGADSITVFVVGEVDLASEGLLEEAVSLLGDEPVKLIVDLCGVTFLDSMGLNMLVRVHAICARNGGSLIVASPSDHVRQLLKLSRVDEVVQVMG
jgi:anti-anti-sigma factor